MANDPALTDVQVAVAWLKQSGVRRVRDSLGAVRARGGTVRIILGIDEGGATKQGLALAMDVADEVFVFHDRSGRTFHPKVYLASGEYTAQLFVGSHNMTAGGVYFNYEAAVLHELDLREVADRILHDDVLDFFNRLRADTPCCLRLDQELFDRLRDEPQFQIGDEDNRTRAGGTARDGEGSEETDYEGHSDPPLSPFGSSNIRKRSDPTARGSGRARRGPTRDRRPFSSTEGSPPLPTGSPGPRVLARWSKRMSASDAQHPPQLDTAVTGNLRLSKADHDIDHKTYFRYDLFFGADWEEVSPGNSDYEKALVEFDVTISSNHLGPVKLRVDHQPSRVANQNNVATVLKWGELSALMRQEDHTKEWVTLERLSDGTFRLTVQPSPP